MPLDLAIKTVGRYVCANCWGELEHFNSFDGKGEMVWCKTCKDDTTGYVTRYYADRRRTDSVFENNEANRLLRTIGILPALPGPRLRPGETQEQATIRELGF